MDIPWAEIPCLALHEPSELRHKILPRFVNELFPWELGIVWQALIGGTMVTCLEFITGVIVNIWLKLGVWDYSGLPLNILGQVCLPFYFAWVGLSVVAIVFDDYLRYWFFGEEKPHYKIV